MKFSDYLKTFPFVHLNNEFCSELDNIVSTGNLLTLSESKWVLVFKNQDSPFGRKGMLIELTKENSVVCKFLNEFVLLP